MQYNITMTGTISQFRNAWAVYLIRDAVTAAPLMVGTCMFKDMLGLPDVNMPGDKPFIVQMLTVVDTRAEAKQEHCRRVQEFGTAETQAAVKTTNAVQCVKTGELFANANVCAFVRQIDPGALSKHLNGHAGFKTVGGLKYIKLFV